LILQQKPGNGCFFGVNPEVIIVGGGITGLSAARLLSRRGVPFVLVESASQLGGRVQSEFHDGYIWDRGFQILNTGYPEWENQQINIQALSLQSFASGAKIYQDGKVHTLADPFRDGPIALQAFFSKSVSVKDMLLVLKLRFLLKRQENVRIFAMENQSTLQFLQQFGFSTPFIEAFFKPFYSGILLESALNTPASMFAFVFKAFAEGTAALPEQGMQQLVKLLSSEINDEAIFTNSKVTHVHTGKVLLEDGTSLSAPNIWLTTGTRPFHGVQRKEWLDNHTTSVLYFSTDIAPNWGRFIGLNANKNGLINHFCTPSAVQSSYSPKGKHLLSISLKPQINYVEGMEHEVMAELTAINAFQHPATFLKAITIPAALPNLASMRYEPELIPLHDGVLATGDFAAYPSLNAALHAGRLLVESL
jgi:protoporphyrinogen oxidase